MKKSAKNFLFILFVTLGLVGNTFAQAPEGIIYQAEARDENGNLIRNQTLDVLIKIIQDDASGSEVWEGLHEVTTSNFGIFVLIIGHGTNTKGYVFENIDWGNHLHFLNVQVKTTKGKKASAWIDMGTVQLLSVPYALHSKTAETVTGTITETDPVFQGSEAANITATDITNLGNLSGTNTGDQDISGIAVNADDISTLQGEQITQNTAIALNTAKVGITTAQATTLSNTTGINTGDQNISGIAVNADDISTLQSEQITQNTAIALNTAKVGITTSQATILSNTTGINTGDQDISGIAVNAHDISTLQREQITQNTAIALNTAKTGITTAEQSKLAGIAAGAEVNVQADWNQTTTTADDYIKNKPTNIAAADGSETIVTAGTNVTVTGEGTTASPYVVGQTPGTQTGQMLYWNGSAWVTIASGIEGQVLTFFGGLPTWKTTVEVVENPSTGKIWMDRNLGASQVAISPTDAMAYGDLYQWGRANDGHEKRTSRTTTTLSSSDTPGHDKFIITGISPYEWRSPQNDNLWQGVSGTNNPCPSGYRLPTEAEWDAERLSWSSNNAAGAFASPLKLPVAGYRGSFDGSLNFVGSLGSYWSSSVNSINSRSLYFYSSNAYMNSNYRSQGLSVRCFKE